MNIGLLVKCAFDSGTFAVFSGIGNIDFDGVTYRGIGQILSIGQTTASIESGKSGLSITLSGIDPEVIAIAELEEFQRRRVTVYIATLDGEGQLISTTVFFDGLADDMETNDDPTGPVLTLYCEQRALDLARPRPFKYLPEDQKKRHPGDTFFDLVAAIQNRDDVWGV